MTYNEAMEYITGLKKFGSNYGLERTERLLELLGNPHKKLKCVHIAGTNGKGSTAAMITKILRGAGYKTGMYTSPCLEEFEERIQINGENIKKENLAELTARVRHAADRVLEEGLDQPTEFEVVTAIMFLYFYEEKTDYAVIEVGLGGRLDSTNVMTPKVSVIASISFDHTNILGNTLEEIALEKAGIIKEKVPVVLYPQKSEAEKVILEKAEKMHSRVYKVKRDEAELIKINYEDPSQSVQVKGIENIYNIKLPLLGEHQILNLALAVRAVEVLFKTEHIKIDKNMLENSLKDVKWIGRLETLNKKPLLVIDGAHNIDGITSLRKNVERYFKYDKIYLLLGILADKQVSEMIDVIAPIAYKITALTPHNERAESAEELKKEIEKVNPNVTASDDYEEALKLVLREAGENDLILISGSLYMIGDMRKIITKNVR